MLVGGDNRWGSNIIYVRNTFKINLVFAYLHLIYWTGRQPIHLCSQCLIIQARCYILGFPISIHSAIVYSIIIYLGWRNGRFGPWYCKTILWMAFDFDFQNSAAFKCKEKFEDVNIPHSKFATRIYVAGTRSLRAVMWR